MNPPKNNRTGIETRWKAKGYSLTDEQKAELIAQVAIKQKNRKAEQQALHIKVADALQELLAIAPAADSEHPYLKEKRVRPGNLRVVPQNADELPHDSLIKIGQNWQEVKVLREEYPDSLVFASGDLLLVAQDVLGQIWSVQTIQPSGAKLFVAGSKKENNFHVVGGESQELTALDAAPAIVIAEGYATADTLSQALNYPVIAAFDSGNLPKVAQDLHHKYPHKPIIIAGDDDHHLESTLGKNPGKEKALEAAALVNGTAVFPVFAPGEQDSKKLNDFNDLANKSALGIEAVKLQVGSVVEKVSQQVKQDSLMKLQTCFEGSVALSVFRPNRSLISLKNNCRELLNATEPPCLALTSQQNHQTDRHLVKSLKGKQSFFDLRRHVLTGAESAPHNLFLVRLGLSYGLHLKPRDQRHLLTKDHFLTQNPIFLAYPLLCL